MTAVLALAFVVSCAAGQAQELRQQAESLARRGQTNQALDHFERILASDPDDVEARLWVARLLRRTGHSHLAEQEFRRVLTQAPQHVDALIGLARLLNERRQVEEAASLLDRAEALSPENPDLLAARGRAAALAGRMSSAEGFLSRARQLSPEDADITRSFEQVRRANRHRVEGSLQHESNTGSDFAAHVGEIAVDLRASDRLRVSTRVQAHRRFAQEEARAGGGIEWRMRPNLTLRASSLIGPGADIIARTDTTGDVEYVQGRVEFAAGVRRVGFSTADVWIYSPGVTVWLDDDTAVGGRYYASHTTFGSGLAETNGSGMVRVRRRITERAWLDAAYSRGYESFDTLSLDRLGTFRADTVLGGVLFQFATLQSLSTSVDYQRRSDSRSMVRLTASMVHRF